MSKGVDYRCVIQNITRSYAINRFNNSKLDDYQAHYEYGFWYK